MMLFLTGLMLFLGMILCIGISVSLYRTQDQLTGYYYNLFKNYSSDFHCDDALVKRGYDNQWYQRFQSQFRDRKLAQKYEDQVPILLKNDTVVLAIDFCFLGICCVLVPSLKVSHSNWGVFNAGGLFFEGFFLIMVILYGTGHLSRSNPELVSVVKMIRSGKLKKFIMNTTTRHHLRANLWLLQNIYLFYALLNPQTYADTRNYFQSHQGAAKIKQFFTFIQNPALQKCLTTDQATFDSVQTQIAQELDQLVSSSLTLLQQGLPVDLNQKQAQAEQEQQQILHQGQQVLQQHQQATHSQTTTIDQASQTLKQAQEIWKLPCKAIMYYRRK